MPSKTKALAARQAAFPAVPKELVDQFCQGPMTADAVNDACLAFKKALMERALGAELGHHLGYPPGGAKPAAAENHRNDSTGKTLLTDTGKLRIEVPRDRDGNFAPLLIPKHERRFTGFDDKIIGMAEPATGADVSGGIFRCAAREDS